jgi:hypothetical protein
MYVSKHPTVPASTVYWKAGRESSGDYIVQYSEATGLGATYPTLTMTDDGYFAINGTTEVAHILDEDNFASDSDIALATQQSIKAYCDALVGGSDTQVQFNDGGVFGGEAEFVYDKANHALTVGTRAGATGGNSAVFGTGCIASGNYAFAQGSSEASGNYSHAEGSSRASGNTSHSEGAGCIASGAYSHAEGEDTESGGRSSHSEGKNSNTYLYGMHAKSSGAITAHRNQYCNVTATVETTDATPTYALINNTYYIVIPQGFAWKYRYLAIGSDASGNVASYEGSGTIKNIAGTVTLVESTDTETHDDFTITGITAVADTVNDALGIQVTGAAATTIWWSVFVEWTEIQFA